MKIFRFVLILALAFCSGQRLHAKLVDGILAVINDTVITRQQVEDFVLPAVESLQREYAGQPAAVIDQKYNAVINDGLEQLVERQLILHDFEAEGYRMPDSYLEQLVQDRIRDRYSDRVTLMKTLQAEGQTLESFRDDVRDQTIVTFMRSKNVSQEIIISPYRVETYYRAHQDDYKVEDEIKLRMIVLNKTAGDETNALNLAREIRDTIKAGKATFAEMASTYSQDSLRSQGGDRGWVERSVLRKDLADAAFALQPGEVSDVIETPAACYLVSIEEKRVAHVKPLSEVRDDVERGLRAQEQARLEKQWIARMKAKTFILYF